MLGGDDHAAESNDRYDGVVVDLNVGNYQAGTGHQAAIESAQRHVSIFGPPAKCGVTSVERIDLVSLQLSLLAVSELTELHHMHGIIVSASTRRGARRPRRYRRREMESSLRAIESIDQRLDALAKQPFRARFHLHGRERALVHLRGVEATRRHAKELIAGRVAPAQPRRDGRQTPYRGHPVFVAQHATATCCRGCLERNHQIGRGHELMAAEQRYVVDVIMRWIEREIPGAPR